MRTLTSFRNAHAGEAVVVCGCGESLNRLAAPERFVTVGVNDVGRRFTPDYLVVVNPRNQFAGDRFRYVEHSRARYVFTQLELGLPPERVVKFRLGTYGGTDFANAEVLHYTQNSPYVALCLAVQMGARQIGLIGVDFTDHHFFARTGRHALTPQLKTIDEQYRRLNGALRARGVEVFNLSAASRLTAFPRMAPEEFAARFGADASALKIDERSFDKHVDEKSFDVHAGSGSSSSMTTEEPLRVVSYATTPVAGVPVILARSIAARTAHGARCVWSRNDYGNGVAFDGDLEWTRQRARAEEELRAADIVVVHNGKVEPHHVPLLAGKPVVTMAHNYMWNVEQRFVREGFPGVVVGQYQASLAEFKGWSVVPNPVPLWEPQFQPGRKGETITICYTPSGKHEKYPAGHRLYWHSKGYETTMRVLERLAARCTLRLEVIRDRQVSHAESLAMKRRAHVVIDECVTGSYHRNSLEGLAAGCVVVNGLGLLPEIAEVFRRCAPTAPPQPPFVRAGLAQLEAVLTSLVERGASSLAESGAANRRWMEEHWDFAAQWERFWAPVVARARSRAGRARTTRSAPRGADNASAPRATGHGTTANGHTPDALNASTQITSTVVNAPTEMSTATRAAAQSSSSSSSSSTSSTQMPSSSSSQTTRAPLRLVERARAGGARRDGVCVVIPHGGRARLPHLATTLARLEEIKGVRSCVVVEMDDAPHALAVARRLADGYAFIRNDGGLFHKARAMNAGSAFADAEVVLWLDNDLLLPADFLPNALAEMHRRRLDCLVPWTSVRYLSREDTARVFEGQRTGVNDCRHVNAYFTRQGACGGAVLVRRAFLARHGGMCEEFRGWGGEDNAWFYKARVVGAAAVTARQDQHLYHLFHEHSGGYDATNHLEKNPHYEQNVALLYATRRLNTRDRLLARFPAPAHLTCPWDTSRRIAFVTREDDDEMTTAALETIEALRALYGINAEHVVCQHDASFDHATRSALFDAADGCDALVIFDDKLTLRLLSDEDLKDAWPKTVAVHTAARAANFSDEERDLLRRAAAHFSFDDDAARALEETGLDCWRAFGDEASSDDATARARGLVQPLSLVLAALPPSHHDAARQRRLHLRTDDSPMNTDYTLRAPVPDLAFAREADLALTEYAAFNHGRDYPRMSRWALPFALFKSRLSSTSSVLDCTLAPADFAARLHGLYPHALYRHHNPVQQNQYAPPLDVPDASFDRALCVNTLEHLPAHQRDALVGELACKLKPGGLLVLTSDFYSEDLRANAELQRAGVVREDRLTPEALTRLCARHGLRPLADDATWAAPAPNDNGLYRNDGPYPHASLGAVFRKGDAAPLIPQPKKIVLALLTWNTRDISLEALAALVREAATLKRLGHEASIVVCDNGSTDGTREALSEADEQIAIEHRFILNDTNRGSSVARNQLIDLFLEAGGDYLLFTDGDIELVPFSSFAMLRHAEDAGHLLGCVGAAMHCQSPLRERTTRFVYSLADFQVDEDNLLAWTQYGLFRREVFEAGVLFDVAHPFDREGWGCEDNDLAFQLHVKGYRIRRFTGMTYLHRNINSSVRVLRALGVDPEANYEQRRRYVINKWAATPDISRGPLAQLRKFRVRFSA